MTKITLIDRPCGWGKTTELIETLNRQNRYIIVVPLLSETIRIQEATAERGIEFHRPGYDGSTEVPGTKGDHLRSLMQQGRNIVCTHELIYRIGTVSKETRQTLRGPISFLASYHLIIDEVLNPFDVCSEIKPSDFEQDYIGLGLATTQSDGLVAPTEKWDAAYDRGSKTFNSKLYVKAKSGALYFQNDGIFIETFPVELLTKAQAVTIYTFLNEGSYFRLFVDKLAKQSNSIKLVVDSLNNQALATWREDVDEALTIDTIPAFAKINLSFSGQTRFKTRAERDNVAARAGNALMNLRTRSKHLSRTSLNQIMLTCARDNWYSSERFTKPRSSHWSACSRMFGRPSIDPKGIWQTDGVNWVANTTRGTNQYSNCCFAIYLFDQFPNPALVNFLLKDESTAMRRQFVENFALTELIQWVFRSRIRVGGFGQRSDGRVGFRGQRQTATLYLPSARMRKILENWLKLSAIHTQI